MKARRQQVRHAALEPLVARVFLDGYSSTGTVDTIELWALRSSQFHPPSGCW
jgi:hypothetical protein